MTLALDLPPGIELRPYQLRAVDEARAAVRQGKRPVIVQPAQGRRRWAR